MGVVLVSLLLTLNYFTPCSIVCIVNFEQVNAGWEMNEKVTETVKIALLIQILITVHSYGISVLKDHKIKKNKVVSSTI